MKTIKNLALLSVLSILTGLLSAQSTNGNPDLPFRTLSEFGTDTVSFIGYNFLERSSECYQGMTVNELIALLPFPQKHVSPYIVYPGPKEQVKYPNIAIYLLQEEEVRNIHSTPFVVADLEKGLNEEDYVKAKDNYRKYTEDKIINGASVDSGSFMLYWNKVQNQHRRKEYSAERTRHKELPFKCLSEFDTDTLAYLQCNFTDRERTMV